MLVNYYVMSKLVSRSPAYSMPCAYFFSANYFKDDYNSDNKNDMLLVIREKTQNISFSTEQLLTVPKMHQQ